MTTFRHSTHCLIE